MGSTLTFNYSRFNLQEFRLLSVRLFAAIASRDENNSFDVTEFKNKYGGQCAYVMSRVAKHMQEKVEKCAASNMPIFCLKKDQYEGKSNNFLFCK